jgi:transcriptional regulator with XRE-family HTH domain
MTVDAKALEFGAYLRKLREASRMTKEDLARESKCSTEHVRRLELGYSRASPELLARMLKALDTRAHEERRAWVLLADSYLPDGIRRRVEVHPAGAETRAGKGAVEWVKKNLGLPAGEDRFLSAHVRQRMKQ